MFLKIQNSLYSFQIITHVSTIYQTHYHQKHILKMCNINIFLTQKHKKQSSGHSSYGSYLCECTYMSTPKNKKELNHC
jgi:hypothetical protein